MLMDFSYLLDLAKQNEEHAREAIQVKRYSTQVSASKKVPRSGVQSQAIQAFLAKKDNEERSKQVEALKKKETLLTLRAQDRKSNARVQAMLKRTKAANKAVLDEAKNSLNGTITHDEQPDEDDYGYVSNEASAFYKKLIDKYSVQKNNTDCGNKNSSNSSSFHMPKEKPKPELKKHKDLPQTQTASKVLEQKKNLKNHSEAKSNINDLVINNSSKDKVLKKSTLKSVSGEASLSFDQILKLAAAKQREPLKFESKKKEEKPEKIPLDNERLMTKKEKEEYLRRKQEEQERHLRKLGKLPAITSNVGKSANPTVAPSSQSKDGSVGKARSSKETFKSGSLPIRANNKISAIVGPTSKNGSNSTKSNLNQTKIVPQASNSKQSTPRNPVPCATEKTKPSSTPTVPKLSQKGKSISNMPGPSRPIVPNRPRHSRDIPQQSYKRSLESDEEYDSELDDFIDDGPIETEDYSKHIQEIFGYDKSKYRRIESDDEDECMESSFAQQMREERISTRIGIMEDLEEERLQREEEDRKKKKAKMRK